MKATPRETSTKGLCELLQRSRLLTADESASVYRRWMWEAKDPSDLGSLGRWLVANRYVTQFQLALLLHGRAEQLFLGEYKLLDRIGKGRLAVVYKAADAQARVVALKVLPPSKARDPRLLARFQHEARLACLLEHPHVVRGLRSGQAGELHFLVFEHLEGETLAEALERRGRLQVREAVGIVHQALLGTQYLFEQGIVHRNLEPANLMLVHTAAAPGALAAATVKLLDTSLSRSLYEEPSPGAGPRVADDEQLLGNSAYQAPEQTRAPQASDVRADIYSLGCILYRALAGTPPLGDTAQLDSAPARPLREVVADAPDGLQPILDRMLAHNPADRYATPAAAAADLQSLLRSESAEIRAAAREPAVHPTDEPEPPIPALPTVAAWQAQGETEYVEVEALPDPLTDGILPPDDFLLTAAPAAPFGDAAPAGFLDSPQASPILYGSGDRGGRRERAARRRRDYLLMMLGALGLAAAQVVGWLLARVLAAYPDI